MLCIAEPLSRAHDATEQRPRLSQLWTPQNRRSQIAWCMDSEIIKGNKTIIHVKFTMQLHTYIYEMFSKK